MAEHKGPITLITDLSEKRNRWKALAFAWRSAAISSIPGCSDCGSPALWHQPDSGRYWCGVHYDNAPTADTAGAKKTGWHAGLARALELEEQIAAEP